MPAAAESADVDNRRQLFADLQSLIIEVSDRVLPSVVHVKAIQKKNGRRNKVTGSGFFLDSEGRIVTNEHVVAHAEKVEITFSGLKGNLAAEVIGVDQLTDLALLKIDPGDVKISAAVLGDDKKLRVGDWVLAIGNPYGLDGTVSFGIVSAKGRNLGQDRLINEFIQTDAMIDFGSSGGPLVNLEGEVVGVNSMGQGRGIGFTIPISTVKEVTRKLSDGGVDRGWLGVRLQPLDRDLAEYLGDRTTTGVIVTQVVKDSPAEDAGLRAGDVLVKFDGRVLEAEDDKEINEFRRQVAQAEIGSKVEINFVRDGRMRKSNVILGAQPKVEGDEFETEFGFQVQEITTSQVLRFRLARRDGVMVSWVERGSPASEAGLEQGDVILSVDDQQISTLQEFRDALNDIDSRSRFLVKVQRGDAVYLSLIKPFGNLPQ